MFNLFLGIGVPRDTLEKGNTSRRRCYREKKNSQNFPMVFLVAILVKVFIIHHHKNDMHNMARSDFFGGGGSGFSSTKASNNTCSSCFHSLAEIGDLKKARPMISSENGFHGGSPEAHQQFWPKTFGSQLGRMKKKTKQKNLPSTHTLQKVGEKIIQSNHHPILFFVSDTHCFSFFSC